MAAFAAISMSIRAATRRRVLFLIWNTRLVELLALQDAWCGSFVDGSPLHALVAHMNFTVEPTNGPFANALGAGVFEASINDSSSSDPAVVTAAGAIQH